MASDYLYLRSGKRRMKEAVPEQNRRNVKPRLDADRNSAPSHVDWQSTKKTVSERTHHMFNNHDMSDISFTCKDSVKIFYAHKYVLATSSAVFKAMFFGNLAKKNSVLHLTDTDERGLEEFLRFLYTDRCNLTADNVLSVMNLSKKYIVPSLTVECVNFLDKGMDPENVLAILEWANHFDNEILKIKSWSFLDSHIDQIVTLESFKYISHYTLASILKRDSLSISEVQLFRAVLKWSDFQCSQKGLDLTRENRRSVIGDAIYDLRFLAMDEKEFVENVGTSGLFTPEEIIPISKTFHGIQLSNLKWTLSTRRHHQPNQHSEEQAIMEYISQIINKFTPRYMEDMKRMRKNSVESHLDWQSTKKTVSERNHHMFNNPNMSDISFTCEGSDKMFYAHKYVLGTSSTVFKAMFFGNLAEKDSVLHLIDTDEESLEEFLRFLYTDRCCLTAGNVLSVMYLSKKYIVPLLTKECVNHLRREMDLENVLAILEWAIYFDEKSLEMESRRVLNLHFDQIVTLESFKYISKNMLASILKGKRKSFFITKVKLCRAVLKWVDFQCSQKGLDLTRENRRSVIGDALHDLRFIAMDVVEVAKNVKTSGMLPPEEIIPILHCRRNFVTKKSQLSMV